jgi:hypothetical protein
VKPSADLVSFWQRARNVERYPFMGVVPHQLGPASAGLSYLDHKRMPGPFRVRPPSAYARSQIDHSVMAITTAEVICRHALTHKRSAGDSGHLKGEMAMHTLAFAIAAVALGIPFLVPLMWGQIEA